MRPLQTSILLLLAYACRVNAQADIENLIGEVDPTIQKQINRVYSLSLSPAGDGRNTEYEALEELQRLKDFTKKKDEIVRQLAIFVATT